MTIKNSKINILIWSSSFYPKIGGLETVTANIATKLFNDKWNVRIITNHYPRTLGHFEVQNNVKIYRYTFLHGPLRYLKSKRLDLFFAWLFYKPITTVRLIRNFMNFKPTFVNIHFPDHQLFEAYFLSLFFRFKLIISFHGDEVNRMDALSVFSLRYFFLKKLLDHAYCITCCSQMLTRKCYSIFPNIKRNKYLVLHNGVNEKFLNKEIIKSKENFIFCVARPTPVKGVDLLIKALEKTSTRLIIAGISNANNNDLNVDFIGKKPSKEIASYLSRASITVVPSRFESYGIVVAEAICCGSPIIATQVGGIPEIIKLFQNNMSNSEKKVVSKWIRLVKPDYQSISEGINQIINYQNGLDDYLEIIEKHRSLFCWDERLAIFKKLLN